MTSVQSKPRRWLLLPFVPSSAWLLVIFCFGFSLVSCQGATISSFEWKAASGESLPFTQKTVFPEGSEGVFTLSRASNTYVLRKPVVLGSGEMLAVKLNVYVDNPLVVFRYGNGSGATLREVRFAPSKGETTFYLSSPQGPKLSTCSIALAPPKNPGSGQNVTSANKDEPIASIQWIAVLPSFQGYESLGNKRFRLSDGFSYAPDSANSHNTIWSIENFPTNAVAQKTPVDKQRGKAALVVKYANPVNAEITILAGTRFNAKCSNPTKSFVIPLTRIDTVQSPIRLRIPNSVSINAAYIEFIPEEQIRVLDPGLMLISQGNLEGDYEYCRWNVLPNVLVFDFKNYATQDSYLKRIAFYVEKRGFAGRLASDSEITSLHGWNAHDYRSEDLAAFFSAASTQNFPLNQQEVALRDFLIKQGIIAKDGQSYKALGGAIISLSQESPLYLRHTFLTHESSHAVFFVDESYRNLCISMWNSMSDEEKWFWYLYFGWMNYNTGSAYLMANEMQAYLVQQPYSAAEKYFSTTPVNRMLEHHPELKEKLDAYMVTYGSSFTTRAQTIQNWLEKKYGFAPGTTFFIH